MDFLKYIFFFFVVKYCLSCFVRSVCGSLKIIILIFSLLGCVFINGEFFFLSLKKVMVYLCYILGFKY